MKILKYPLKWIFVYSFAGGLYLLLETLWDWSTSLPMYYLAGFVGLFAMCINNFFSYEMDFLLQCTIVTVLATLGEGFVGNIWNTDYSMWDYRNLPLSFWNDQINVFFIIMWFVLVATCIIIVDYIEWRLFNYKKDTPPYYKVFGFVLFQQK